MARIEKKIWTEYFDLVASGEENYELRLVGDLPFWSQEEIAQHGLQVIPFRP